jgi:hypothetical protein
VGFDHPNAVINNLFTDQRKVPNISLDFRACGDASYEFKILSQECVSRARICHIASFLPRNRFSIEESWYLKALILLLESFKCSKVFPKK